MLGESTVPVLMGFFTLVTLSAPVAYLAILAPGHLERRGNRQRAELASNLAALDDALARGVADDEQRERLERNRAAAAIDLARLGVTVPAAPMAAPALARAA